MYFKCLVTFFISSLLVGVSACSPSSSPSSFEEKAEVEAATLTLDGTWQVEDIDNGGIIDNSMITMQFGDDNRIAGSTGCNQYSGNLMSANHTFTVSKVISTRKGCPSAIASQEQRFLAALSSATRYEFKSGTWLVIYDNEDNQRLKLISMAKTALAASQKLDAPSTKNHLFNCDVIGKTQFRLVGPDTIALQTEKFSKVLQRKTKASGAYYEDGNTSFWNKGDTAMLVIEDQAYSCKSSIDEQ